MEKKKQVAPSSSSSLDHLFGPKYSNSPSSTSTTGYFDSLFSSPVVGRENKQDHGNQNYTEKLGNNRDDSVKDGKNGSGGLTDRDVSHMYQNETMGMEPSYFGSSIFYGGQENYSPTTKASESHHLFKKKVIKEDESNSNAAASIGNWWEGSLYY